MLKSKSRKAEGRRQKAEGGRLKTAYCLLLTACCLLFVTSCRQDMQDQPRFEVYEKNDFFKNNLASRQFVEGTVARGHLREDTHLYTGRKSAGGGANAASASNSQNAQGSARGTASQAAQAGESGPTAAANAQTGSGGGGGAAAASAGSSTQAAVYDPNLVTDFPFPVTPEVVNRGQERYNIYCSVCHGATGAGDGMIVRRGYRRPPALYNEQLRQAPVGHFFDVITNGWGSMPNYGWTIPAQDRWAIIAYIRALQLSQEVTTVADTSPAQNSNARQTGGQRP